MNDDVFIDEGWAEGDYPAPSSRTTPASSRRPAFEPTLDGTAAQLDRLRRAVGQGNRPSTPPRTTPSRPATSRQQPTPPRNSVPPATGRAYDQFDEGYDEPVRSTPQGRTRQPTRRQPASDPYTRDPYAADTVEDDYGYYDEYEDDFTAYDEPRRPPRASRPRSQVTVPQFTRPTLPPAIANAALVNDAPALGLIGAGLASLVAMAILVANRVDSLAPGFATHVSASGVLESVKSESALWNLPLTASMLTLMSIVMAWFIAPIDRFASRFVLGAALLVQFVAWVALIRII